MDSLNALRMLKEGNLRYTSGKSTRPTDYTQVRVELAEMGQSPYAVILGCSDSRVPPEIVFDASLGQLFVVRVAGNIADAITIGSVEYAVERLYAPLIVVLGHQKCASIATALYGGDHGPNIGAIIREINPSLEKVRSVGEWDIANRCEDENIRNTIVKLRGSRIISRLIDSKKLLIIGAKYQLETGEVDFWDDRDDCNT
ncbi:MAG: carbonic anhydrase [Oscillospiraceae bacterium]|nr:carbonic anhydrase [Oscillospiraceae bacterium]